MEAWRWNHAVAAPSGRALPAGIRRAHTRWHHGVHAGTLCIGDAAYAMSPIGGVGINLAVQDAVAVANLLHRPLSDARSRSMIGGCFGHRVSVAPTPN